MPANVRTKVRNFSELNYTDWCRVCAIPRSSHAQFLSANQKSMFWRWANQRPVIDRKLGAEIKTRSQGMNQRQKKFDKQFSPREPSRIEFSWSLHRWKTLSESKDEIWRMTRGASLVHEVKIEPLLGLDLNRRKVFVFNSHQGQISDRSRV